MSIKEYVAKEDAYRLPLGCFLDDILGGGIESRVITQLYGPAGTGKTNFCLMALLSCVRRGKKAIFIDTEAGRSLDRLKQLAKKDLQLALENGIFLEPTTFEEQDKIVENLEGLMSDRIGLIIVDSAVALYRLHMDGDNAPATNRQFSRQVSKFVELARRYNIPVIITNQVYSSFEDGSVEPIGGSILSYRSKAIVELKEGKSAKIAVLRRHRSMPENIEVRFAITGDGVKKL